MWGPEGVLRIMNGNAFKTIKQAWTRPPGLWISSCTCDLRFYNTFTLVKFKDHGSKTMSVLTNVPGIFLDCNPYRKRNSSFLSLFFHSLFFYFFRCLCCINIYYHALPNKLQWMWNIYIQNTYVPWDLNDPMKLLGQVTGTFSLSLSFPAFNNIGYSKHTLRIVTLQNLNFVKPLQGIVGQELLFLCLKCNMSRINTSKPHFLK